MFFSSFYDDKRFYSGVIINYNKLHLFLLSFLREIFLFLKFISKYCCDVLSLFLRIKCSLAGKSNCRKLKVKSVLMVLYSKNVIELADKIIATTWSLWYKDVHTPYSGRQQRPTNNILCQLNLLLTSWARRNFFNFVDPAKKRKHVFS